MATIKQIAEITNVSKGTVDRVINNRGGVKPETEKKIRAAMEALNYSPNKAGKNLAIIKRRLKFGFILFSQSDYNPFFDSVKAGIQKKAAELDEFGISVDIRHTHFDALDEQLALLDYFTEQEYSGIAITALNTPDVAAKINEIAKKGIPVVTANTDIPDSGRLAYVGSNYYQCGEVAANMMGLITNGQARLGIIGGSYSIMCLTERSNGFLGYLSKHYPDIEVVNTSINNKYDEIESYLLTKSMLENHPEIDAVFLAAAGVTGACRAISEIDRTIKVIAYDLVPATEELLRAGILDVVIDQNPLYQGSKPLEILFEAATTGTEHIREYYYTDAVIKIRTSL